jgi:hypothetical protein
MEFTATGQFCKMSQTFAQNCGEKHYQGQLGITKTLPSTNKETPIGSPVEKATHFQLLQALVAVPFGRR